MMFNDTLDRLLQGCLEREGKILIDHNGVEHEAFFRRNRDKNSTTDHLTLFHRGGIVPGLELRFADGDPDIVLLPLNAEHVEGSVYRRSDALRCNTFVDFCSTDTGYDEKGDRVTVAAVFDANVPVFLSSGADSVLLALKADDVRFVCSGRHGISSDCSIAVTGLKKGNKNTFTQSKLYYQPTIVDYANYGNGTIPGLLTVSARTDTRYPNST